MVKRILFLTGSGKREILIWKIYQEMKKKEKILPHFISQSKMVTDSLLSLGIAKESITEIFASQEKSKPDLKYLQECEKKYDFSIWDAWSVTVARDVKKRSKIKPKEVFSYFQYVFEKTEKLVKEIKPDYCISYGEPAGYTCIIYQRIFQKNHINTLYLKSSVLSHRFRITNDLSNIEQSLRRSYAEIINQGISAEEKDKIERFISSYQNEPSKPDCLKKFQAPLKNKIKKYWSYAYLLLKYRKIPTNLRQYFWPLIQKAYDYSGIFEKPNSSDKYVLFPLHFQPEASTLIHGKWYVDQATLIENLSRSIPITHKLYVKEHSSGYGNRRFKFYKRIKRLPNVKLIGPHENNFKLIKNCSLLATITGSSGWEALLFQKPVITFGNMFYNLLEETKRVEKIEELPAIIKERLDKKINYSNLVNFVAAVFRSNPQGLFRLPGNCAGQSLEDENIKQLAKGIMTHIDKIENWSG